MNFLERYREFLGKDYKDFEDYLKFKTNQTIRVNTLKIDEADLIKRLKGRGVIMKKIPWLKYGHEIKKSPFGLGSCPEYLHGYFFIQEAAAQLPVQLLSPSRSDLVLDCCASPGAKTTQIAQFMQNEGKLLALDFKKTRLFALRNNLERCGVKNTIVYEFDSRNLEKLNLDFDKILVDAPCSGNFVQERDWFKKRTLHGIKKNTEKQKAILKSALDTLKSGGLAVYSTCSLEPEENELIVQYAIDNFNIKIEKPGVDIGSSGITEIKDTNLDKEIKNCVRFWPHITKTQGFFAAKIRKL